MSVRFEDDDDDNDVLEVEEGEEEDLFVYLGFMAYQSLYVI